MSQRRWSLRNARNSPFELWVSIVAIVNVIAFVLKPNANPIHVLVAPADLVWAIIYGLAGALIFVGLIRADSSQLEAAGLVLLITGIAVQLIIFGTLGVATLTGTWGTLISLGSLAALTVWRFRVLAQASRAAKATDGAVEK